MFILAISIVVLCNQHQDIVDVDFHLFHEFHFKHNIVHDAVFIARFRLDFIIHIMVCTCVVLKINRGQDFVSGKTVKGGEDISQAENVAEQNNKIFFALFSDDGLSQRELSKQLSNPFLIAILLAAFIIYTTVVIILIGFQKNDAARFPISEQGNCIISRFFEVSETNDIAKSLYRIQNSVRSGKCLYQAVHFQVFINPKRI